MVRIRQAYQINSHDCSWREKYIFVFASDMHERLVSIALGDIRHPGADRDKRTFPKQDDIVLSEPYLLSEPEVV